MKYIVVFTVTIAGCAQPPQSMQPSVYASPPTVQLVVDSRAQQMSRNEVIQATMECEGNNMRAVPIMTKRMISGMMSDIIIDVQCMPKYRLF